ncbi:hypothetical protein BDW60DRAFT_101431 [Aspergillus nidulans var. acristatus]
MLLSEDPATFVQAVGIRSYGTGQGSTANRTRRTISAALFLLSRALELSRCRCRCPERSSRWRHRIGITSFTSLHTYIAVSL